MSASPKVTTGLVTAPHILLFNLRMRAKYDNHPVPLSSKGTIGVHYEVINEVLNTQINLFLDFVNDLPDSTTNVNMAPYKTLQHPIFKCINELRLLTIEHARLIKAIKDMNYAPVLDDIPDTGVMYTGGESEPDGCDCSATILVRGWLECTAGSGGCTYDLNDSRLQPIQKVHDDIWEGGRMGLWIRSGINGVGERIRTVLSDKEAMKQQARLMAVQLDLALSTLQEEPN